MRFSNFTKRVLSLAVAAAVAATAVAVPAAPKKADAAGSYSAYLCFSSLKYNGVRNNHNDAKAKLGVFDGNAGKSISGIKCSNATFKKGKVNFTVSVTGANLKKFKGDKGWNAIYVDTSLPGKSKSKLKISSLTLKMDGKTVKTIKNPTLTPDPGANDSFTQIMCINSWNTYSEKKCKAASIKTMPTKSMSITVTGTLK